MKRTHYAAILIGALMLIQFGSSPRAFAAAQMSGSVTLSSLGAYVTTDAKVQFTLEDTVEPNDKIIITFPAGFDLKNTKVESCDTLDGTFSKTIDNQQLKMTRNNDGDPLTATTTVTCLLSGVKNPGPGASGFFTVTTSNPGGVIINTTSGISNVNIIGGVLTNATVTPYSLTVDTLYLTGVDFTTTDPIPKDGKLQVVFPVGFDVSAATTEECTLGVVKTTVANQTVTIARNGNGAILPAGTVVQCQVNNIKNPAAGQNTGTFIIRITTASGTKIAESTTPGVAIVNGTLANISIIPSSTAPGDFTTVSLKFTVSDILPSDGIVSVDFPAGYDAGNGNAKVCSMGLMDVEFTALNVRLKRNGENPSLPVGTVISCELGNIKNPPANSTGTFVIMTTAVDGTAIDYADSIVPGVTISVSKAATPSSSGSCEGFSDVASTDPLCPAIKFVKEKKIFSGYPDGSFKPKNIINRVETTKVILVAFGKSLQNCAGNDGFKDSDATQWYCKYVHTAKLLGILKGYPDGTLRPTQQINRAEMLKIFFETMGTDLAAVIVDSNPYPDALKTQWYAKYVQLAKNNALVDASADGKFYPAMGMKRGDVALLFYRAHLAGMI